VRGSALRGELVLGLEALQPLRGEWDGLAIERARPFCAPAWMLSWWRHVAPAGAMLRTIAVFEGNHLLAIAPFFAEERPSGVVRYRLLGAGASGHLEPLARAGEELRAATVIAGLLSSTSPHPDVITFEGISRRSPWPRLLRETWPGGPMPLLRRRMSMPAPMITFSDSTYAEWLSSIAPTNRRELRRRRRRITERGGAFRLATSESAAVQGLAAFASLHYERWRSRGGSGVLNPRIELMLADVARELVGDLRFRLWSMEVGDRVISSQIFVAAGGGVTYWLGGFDEEWAAYGPSIQTVWAAIEHAWACGDQRMDMGPGGQEYKYLFARAEETVDWIDLIPRTLRSPITRLRLLPEHLGMQLTEARHNASRRLSQKARERLKKAMARIHRGR